MSDFKERISRSSAALRGVYGSRRIASPRSGKPDLVNRKPGVFNANALALAREKDDRTGGSAHRKRIHKTRVALTVGNVLTLGTINLYYLLKGAGEIKKSDAAEVLNRSLDQMVVGLSAITGLERTKLKQQIEFDLGHRTNPPEFETIKDRSLFNTTYGLARLQGRFPDPLETLLENQ